MCSNCTGNTFYRAPSNIKVNGVTCQHCGEVIEPGESIADLYAPAALIGNAGEHLIEEVIHERCAEFEVAPPHGWAQ